MRCCLYMWALLREGKFMEAQLIVRFTFDFHHRCRYLTLTYWECDCMVNWIDIRQPISSCSRNGCGSGSAIQIWTALISWGLLNYSGDATEILISLGSLDRPIPGQFPRRLSNSTKSMEMPWERDYHSVSQQCILVYVVNGLMLYWEIHRPELWMKSKLLMYNFLVDIFSACF
jgi:hypothetical protein